MSASATPWRRSSSTAPATSGSVTSRLNRLAAIATRRPLPSMDPSYTRLM